MFSTLAAHWTHLRNCEILKLGSPPPPDPNFIGLGCGLGARNLKGSSRDTDAEPQLRSIVGFFVFVCFCLQIKFYWHITALHLHIARPSFTYRPWLLSCYNGGAEWVRRDLITVRNAGHIYHPVLYGKHLLSLLWRKT